MLRTTNKRQPLQGAKAERSGPGALKATELPTKEPNPAHMQHEIENFGSVRYTFLDASEEVIFFCAFFAEATVCTENSRGGPDNARYG